MIDLGSASGLGAFLSRWDLRRLGAGFVAGGWLGRRLSDLTAEDLADLGVPRAVRGELLAALRAELSAELAGALGAWMTPLAHPAVAYLKQDHPRLRLWSACDLVEMALRLVVIFGLAQVRATHDGRLPRDRLRRVFEHIPRPTLGNWREMAQETSQMLETGEDPQSRDLGALLASIARPLSALIGHGEHTETASLLRLRNMLAHGSVSTGLARDLAERWRPRIDDVLARLEPLAHLPLIARTADGHVVRIGGEAGTVEVVPDIDPAAVGTRAGAAALGLPGRVLPLTPFVLHGVPRVGEVRGRQAVPQVFLRRSEVALEYMTLGSEDAAFGQGDEDDLQDFEQLFEAPRGSNDRRFRIPGFEPELRRDSEQLLGRTSELEALWKCATGPEWTGLHWLHGPPGIGKSILMARFMVDLVDEAEERKRRGSEEPWMVLAYRFRSGHESCRSSIFLAFLRERLRKLVNDPEAWRAIGGLDDRQAVLMLLPLAARQARVVVALDGLDEIAAAEPSFLSLNLAGLIGAGGLWVCTGRPEGQLPEIMQLHGAREIVHGGLGGLETAAIRTMILEKAGLLGRKLLAGDNDGGDGRSVVNSFVETVARKSDGLPLYVRHVIGDILGNRLRFLDGRDADSLPPSLKQYYVELVQRCAVGDSHVLATYALCCLSLAYEALSEDAIADLIGRRLALAEGDARHAHVHAALRLLGGMLVRGFTPEGNVGFRIYHESLREYLQQASNLAVTRQDTLDNILCQGAIEPGTGSDANYLYRSGIRHLAAAGRQASAEKLLESTHYLLGRLYALRRFEPIASRELLADRDRLEERRTRRTSTVQHDAAWQDFWELLGSCLGTADEICPGYMIAASSAWEHGDDSPVTKDLETVDPSLIEEWRGTFRKMNRSGSWQEHSLQPVPLGHADRVRELSDGRFVTVHHVRGGDLKLFHPNGHLSVDMGRSRPFTADLEDVIQLSDGKIASWSEEQGEIETSPIFAWNADGSFLSTFDGHAQGTSGLIELANGDLLSWGIDAVLKIWSLKGNGPTIFDGHQGSVIGAVQLRDNTILSWAYDRTLRRWHIDGSCHSKVELTANPERCVVILDRYVIGILEDLPRAFCVDLDSFEISYFEAGSTFHTVISAQDALAILASEDGEIVVWNCWAKSHFVSYHHQGCSRAGLFSGPTGVVVSWSDVGTIVQIDDLNGTAKVLCETRLPLIGAAMLGDQTLAYWTDEMFHVVPKGARESHSSKFGKISDVHFCRNAREVVVLGTEVQLVALRAIGRLPSSPQGGAIAGALPIAGAAFLTWSGANPIRLWSDNGKSVEVLDESLGTGVLGSIAEFLVFSRPEGGATLWDPSTRHTVRLQAEGYLISRVIKLDNGVLAAVGSSIGDRNTRTHIITWTLAGKLLGLWRAGRHLVDIVGYSRGRILSSCWGATVHLWHPGGNEEKSFGHGRSSRRGLGDDSITNVLVLPNGNIQTSSWDGILDAWTEEGDRLWSKDLHIRSIGHYDAERLYAVGWDTIRILDFNGETVLSLPMPSSSEADCGRLFGCHVTSDGEILATYLEGGLTAWSAAGKLRWHIKAHEDSIFEVLKLTDGRVLSRSASGELRLWSPDGSPCGDPFRHVRGSIEGVILLDDASIAVWSSAGAVSVFRE